MMQLPNLIKCYAPPSLGSVMPGNKVMLRSGGPCMTVSGIDSKGDAVCMYEGDGGKIERAIFPLACLTCFGAT